MTVDSNGGFNKSASGIYGGSLANVSLSLDFKDFSSVRLSCECFLDPGKDYMETRGFPDALILEIKEDTPLLLAMRHQRLLYLFLQ